MIITVDVASSPLLVALTALMVDLIIVIN